MLLEFPLLHILNEFVFLGCRTLNAFCQLNVLVNVAILFLQFSYWLVVVWCHLYCIIAKPAVVFLLRLVHVRFKTHQIVGFYSNRLFWRELD